MIEHELFEEVEEPDMAFALLALELETVHTKNSYTLDTPRTCI